MRRSIPSLAAALALAVACTAGDDAATGDTTAGAGGANAATPIEARLTAQGDSGVSGNVRVTPQGNGASLALHLMGTAGAYMGHIHQGSCADTTEAPVVADLGSVTVPAGGMVDHQATASVPVDSLMNGRHFVGFHRQGGGAHVACAELRR